MKPLSVMFWLLVFALFAMTTYQGISAHDALVNQPGFGIYSTRADRELFANGAIIVAVLVSLIAIWRVYVNIKAH